MIVFFTGSYPPDKCGVGDYLSNLVRVMESNRSLDVIVIRSIYELLKLLLFKSGNILHFNVQYPTVGYVGGFKSFKPHIAIILAWIFRVSSSVTLHEYSSLSAKAKFFAKIFKLSTVIIFTTEYEKLVASCFSSSIVIPIASNIPIATTASLDSTERYYDFIHFGMLAPGKGIEQYIDIIRNIRQRIPGCRAALVGYIPKLFHDYGKRIELIARENCIDIFVDQSESDVSNLLSASKISLFPYPDGISERRGTALAAMMNGCMVITLSGKFSLPLSSICLINENTIEMLECSIDAIGNMSKYKQMINCAREYCLKRDWIYLAKQYEVVFNEESHCK